MFVKTLRITNTQLGLIYLMGLVRTRVEVFKELLAPSLCNTKKVKKHILKVAIITSGTTVAQHLLTSCRVN